MSGLSLPSFGNAAASSSLMPLNDFSTMLPDETTDSAGPTPIPTPLGSPRAELQKLSLGMERYARAVEDPAVMGGSFSGTVPLPSLSQSHPPIARQGSTASSSAAAAAAAAMMAMKDRQGGGSGGPLSPSSTVNASTGINLHTLKRAISGKFVGSGSSGAHSGLPHHHAPQSVNDLEAAFDIAERRDSHNAEAVMLEGLGYAPQPILLPAVSATRQQQEAAGDEDVKGSARANTATTTTTNTAAAATFTPVSRSRAPTAASSSVSKGRHMMAMQEVPDSQIRRRKTKGGILSQLLKLQRQEAAAVAAARAAAAATAATSSSSGHSRKRDTARPGGSGVKKSKMGFHYRGSSSKNNSVVDLVSGSVTTTPRVSPRNSTLFESIGPEETMTRLPTQPSTSINAASSPFSRLSRHNSVATHHHHTMEEMEAISAAATAARNLGIHHDIADILGRQSFLILMAKALILYGAPSHRIEETCSRLARKLEVDASFALLPGLMTISFSDPETHTSDTRHLRCTQGMDMYKLSKVYQIALGVLRGDGMEKANKALEAVTTEAGYYPVWVTVMAWMGSSAFVAPLAFKGSWIDCGLAALCGLLVGVLGLVAAKFPIYGNVFEITSSIVVGFIARALGDHVCFSAVALAGVVVLLPGLLLTQAIMELASRNIVSGAVRMFYALMYAFFLGFGLSIGAELWEFITHPSPISDAACEHGVNHWWYWLIFPGVSISINIVFNAHPSQWLGMTLVTAVGFCVSYFMPSSSPQITSAIAAFAVGIAGQAYGRLTGQLSYVPLLSGVLLLVPGSVGVRGTLAFFGSNPSQGFEFALTMINVAMGITLGVFCSALVWYPFWRKATFMNF
ncbi:hypothetical protein DFQ27_003420 [Actinomortierella ambigua]|uniref:Threonine/serine exporter-like N-terminal domain-containing protein n=1 Tax=Actinomortierella ambigua TaxID=1343610 RepID=A0A9P6Q6M8_9FUNG|nr:hypothetical protein DFQ27_003420 [Actinomortierella ambigua]